MKDDKRALSIMKFDKSPLIFFIYVQYIKVMTIYNIIFNAMFNHNYLLCSTYIFSGVTVNSLHPGAFGSEITREAPYAFQFVWKLITNHFFKVNFKTFIFYFILSYFDNILRKYNLIDDRRRSTDINIFMRIIRD